MTKSKAMVKQGYKAIPCNDRVNDHIFPFDVEGATERSPIDALASASEESQLATGKFYMAMIGIGYLFPFSALTQPIDYWHALFPGFNIEFELTALFMWTSLICLFLIVFFGGQNPSFQHRIVGGFIGQLLTLTFVPTLSFFHIRNQVTYFWLIMSATGFVATVTALLDSVLIAFASHYPPKVLEGLQIGIGLSSLIGSIYRILTKLIFPPDAVILSSVIYFYTGAITLLGCIYSYYALLALPISRKYMNKASTHNSHNIAEQQRLTPQSPSNNAAEVNLKRANSLDRLAISLSPKTTFHTSASSTIKLSTASVDDSIAGRLRVLSKVFFYQFLVFATYLTSLTMFPSIITEIPTYNFPAYLEESRWWSLMLLLFFSIWDTVGRFLTPYRFGLTHSNIWMAVLIRTSLFPLIFACLKGYTYFRYDFLSILFTSILGFTNGHLGSVCIMMVSELITDEQEKSLVGGFTGFSLNCGLVLGSSLALVIDKIVLKA